MDDPKPGLRYNRHLRRATDGRIQGISKLRGFGERQGSTKNCRRNVTFFCLGLAFLNFEIMGRELYVFPQGEKKPTTQRISEEE